MSDKKRITEAVWVLDHIPEDGILVGDDSGTLHMLTWEQLADGILDGIRIANHHKPVIRHKFNPDGLPLPHYVKMGNPGKEIIQDAQVWSVQVLKPHRDKPRAYSPRAFNYYHVTATYFKAFMQWHYWGIKLMGTEDIAWGEPQ